MWNWERKSMQFNSIVHKYAVVCISDTHWALFVLNVFRDKREMFWTLKNKLNKNDGEVKVNSPGFQDI